MYTGFRSIPDHIKDTLNVVQDTLNAGSVGASRFKAPSQILPERLVPPVKGFLQIRVFSNWMPRQRKQVVIDIDLPLAPFGLTRVCQVKVPPLDRGGEVVLPDPTGHAKRRLFKSKRLRFRVVDLNESVPGVEGVDDNPPRHGNPIKTLEVRACVYGARFQDKRLPPGSFIPFRRPFRDNPQRVQARFLPGLPDRRVREGFPLLHRPGRDLVSSIRVFQEREVVLTVDAAGYEAGYFFDRHTSVSLRVIQYV